MECPLTFYKYIVSLVFAWCAKRPLILGQTAATWSGILCREIPKLTIHSIKLHPGNCIISMKPDLTANVVAICFCWGVYSKCSAWILHREVKGAVMGIRVLLENLTWLQESPSWAQDWHMFHYTTSKKQAGLRKVPVKSSNGLPTRDEQ